MTDGDRKRGLYNKYNVSDKDGNSIECIVLRFDDPNAHVALTVWASTMEAVGYKQLAADVREKLKQQGMEADPKLWLWFIFGVFVSTALITWFICRV